MGQGRYCQGKYSCSPIVPLLPNDDRYRILEPDPYRGCVRVLLPYQHHLEFYVLREHILRSIVFRC